LIVKKRVANSR